MLPKSYRLNRQRGGHRLFVKTLSSGGLLYQCPYFKVLGLPKILEIPSAPRFGFIISKKVHTRSHERNRLKRQLRALIRLELLPCLPVRLSDCSAVVIIVRPKAVGTAFDELKRHIQHLTRL